MDIIHFIDIVLLFSTICRYNNLLLVCMSLLCKCGLLLQTE